MTGSRRQHLWMSMPLGRIGKVAVFQTFGAVALFRTTEAGSIGRIALVGSGALGILTLPLSRLAAYLSHNHPSVYWWSGRVWAAVVPFLFALTIGDAHDGTGPAFSERACTPFVLSALVSNAFAVGAQGALLAVPRDVAVNMAAMIIAAVTIKLNVAYTHAYLMVQFVGLGALFFGYLCVSKYADVHEAMYEAADAVVLSAAAREPFVVTDAALNIRAVNQCLLNVLGYEEHELVGKPVTILMDEVDSWCNEHEWIRRMLHKSEAHKGCPSDCVWSILTKKGQTHPVRITCGETRCPISSTRMFTAQFSSMRLEQRNMQLQCEKEKLEWEVASHHDNEEDPRELLGATMAVNMLECHDCNIGECANNSHCRLDKPHRILGAMQDQATTDDAVSNANSFDHVASSIESPTVPGHTLIAGPGAPSRKTSPLSMLSIVSYESSVMETVSQAAAKDITRAPPPAKARPPRSKTTASEPSSCTRPKTANLKKSTRVLPGIELDPREYS